MKKLKMIDTFPIPTFDEIGQVEQRTGLAFPEQYKEFLLLGNAGIPDPQNAYFDAGDKIPIRDFEIGVFFSCLHSCEENVEKYLSLYSARIPVDAIPIGDDVNGNLLLMRQGRTEEFVWFWDHEGEGLDDEGDVDNVYDVGVTLSELCDALGEEPLDI